MSKGGSSSEGIGLLGALFLIFLVLKLTKNIDWSWWWVTAPLWIPIGIFIFVVFVVNVVVAIKERNW
tara:strand:+ start:415 stop:615 length:201 start_codon:yes stop_codon:yes gene_type:complete